MHRAKVEGVSHGPRALVRHRSVEADPMLGEVNEELVVPGAELVVWHVGGSRKEALQKNVRALPGVLSHIVSEVPHMQHRREIFRCDEGLEPLEPAFILHPHAPYIATRKEGRPGSSPRTGAVVNSCKAERQSSGRTAGCHSEPLPWATAPASGLLGALFPRRP